MAAGSLNLRTDSNSHANGLNTDQATNNHPTVKPLALMRWLITLVTPPGGIVLDPFGGSFTTLVAAAELGFPAIGIDQEERYCDIGARRVAHALMQPRALTLVDWLREQREAMADAND